MIVRQDANRNALRIVGISEESGEHPLDTPAKISVLKEELLAAIEPDTTKWEDVKRVSEEEAARHILA